MEVGTYFEPHDSFFVGSDVFYTYIVENGWWKPRMEQRTEDGYFEVARELQEQTAGRRYSDEIEEQFRRVIEYFGQSPIIVRSSSLLEDGFGNAFAGKYETIFLANQGTPEQRYEAFTDCVRRIFASTMDEDALTYRLQRGLSQQDEQMALLVHDVAKLSEAQTLEGQPIAIAVKDGETQINDATVTTPEQETANGVIHTIDRVLVPPELRKEVAFLAPPAPTDLVDTALAAGNFKTLSALLKTAGLTDTLKGQGPFTIFAPTDDAFAQLSPESLEALKKDPAKLEALLKYHVVQGALKAADVAKLSEAKTLEGQPIAIAVERRQDSNQ